MSLQEESQKGSRAERAGVGLAGGVASAKTNPAQGLWLFASSSLLDHSSVYSPTNHLLNVLLSGLHISLGKFLKVEGCHLLCGAAGYSCHFKKEKLMEWPLFPELYICHLYCRWEK